MRLLQQLQTIPLFINYFLNVVDQHSIQAPFAFKVYQELKDCYKASNGIEDIERARHQLLIDGSIINGDDFGAGSRIAAPSKLSSVARFGISSKNDCIILQTLATFLKAEICIELGTSLGIATAYLAKTPYMKDVYSFEGNKFLCEKSHQLLKNLNVQNTNIICGNIDNELSPILEKLDQLDLVIIDANHKQEALLRYYQLLALKISIKGAMVIDDIRWSSDMYHGWKQIIRKPEVTLSLEFLNRGFLFFEKGLQKQHYVLTM